MLDGHYPPLSPYATGLAGRCPRCGQGRLFHGFIALNKECAICSLDFDFADAGDGPAVFVIMMAGFLIVGAALWAELVLAPPLWLHLVVFLPLTLVICLGMLRPLKGLLLALQYRNRASEGQRER
ncbi:membrane protein [Agaricicola taiwanensis]|uniref:Membrane protein n=1 Tax=Agaricicola taiwanensis TaxID=591372 RepID=A0A8J2VNT5_9RHOB|nr:DUF983 domain-containing protein [Agaricicola taiwanensis]GGE34671.1 membrane protein [Agaricicola taiwanensis]